MFAVSSDSVIPLTLILPIVGVCAFLLFVAGLVVVITVCRRCCVHKSSNVDDGAVTCCCECDLLCAVGVKK